MERLEDIVEVTETKPDVALLESGNSTMTIREDDVLKVKERLEASDEEERGRQQRCEEKAAPPSGETSETLALTSGKLKLKIKTEGGRRISKVVSEDKENIDSTVNKEVLPNGGETKGHHGTGGERVKVDSVVLTPLSTSERAIDALRRQQNRTPSVTTNSEAGSGTFKDETELNSEVGCDFFSEPEETEQSDIVSSSEKVEEEAECVGNSLPYVDTVSNKDIPAEVEIPKQVEDKKQGPESPKKVPIKKKSLELGPTSKRKSLRSQSVSSESDKSGLTNGHLEDETVDRHCTTIEAMPLDPYNFQDSEPSDPDEFPDPDRSSWLKDNDKFSRCFRFKCPYCTFTDRTRHIVDDHIIIEHSIQGTSKMVPKYGEATKQQMLLLIERDPKLFTKYHEDLLFCEAPMSILEEVCEEARGSEKGTASEVDDTSLVQSAEDEEDMGCNESPQRSFVGSDVLLNDTDDDWMPCDATLPPGWQFKEVRLQNGSLRKSYLSPCGKRLGGRDTVAEFLLCQGLDILHPTGFSETCCLPGITLISSSSLLSGLTLISYCQVCQLPALGSAKEAALPSASTHPSTQQRIPTELGEGQR